MRGLRMDELTKRPYCCSEAEATPLWSSDAEMPVKACSHIHHYYRAISQRGKKC